MDDWQPVRRTSTRASIWLKKSHHRIGRDAIPDSHVAILLVLPKDEVGLSRAQPEEGSVRHKGHLHHRASLGRFDSGVRLYTR